MLPLSKDAVISGSAAWWMLTSDEKTTWLPKDVDVYIKRSAVQEFRKFLHENGGYLMRCQKIDYGGHVLINEEWKFAKPVKTIEPTFWTTQNAEYGLPPYPENVKCCMHDLKPPGSVVQLIIPIQEVAAPSQMITGRFDLPTLESFYDGITMTLSNKQDIDGRISILREQPGTAPMREGRIKKYKSRGLKIYMELLQYVRHGHLVVPSWVTREGFRIPILTEEEAQKRAIEGKKVVVLDEKHFI